MKARKHPETIKRHCRLQNMDVVIVLNIERGSDYCTTSSLCNHMECEYQKGTINPFKK